MKTSARTPERETSRLRGGAMFFRGGVRRGAVIVWLVLFVSVAWAGFLEAQLPLQAVGSPFDILGFIEAATLDGPGDVLAGGTLQVNGHTIVVPRNTILQMPAAALTWQQLFAMAPPPYTGARTGLAVTDDPTPLTTYEAHVQGNRIGDTYIAGLIFISQQSLNAGQGFINFIDYANGELRVGGVIGDLTTGTRVKINDPLGRFAPAYRLDLRFTIDEDNPTVRTETGYPMCFPHFDPAVQDDPLCPQRNRPIDPGTGFPQSIFTMQPPGAAPGPASGTNAWVAAPFKVGDYITYSGTRMKDGPQPSAGPPPPPGGMAAAYIAAHTIIANIGIFTAPGTVPVYVATDVMLLGVGGLPIAGLPQEATVRTRFEGFSTDVSRLISLWGMDVDGCTATTSDRSWGMINVDPGPPTGAVKGRWRFIPPGKIILMPPAGTFLPATRMMRSVAEGAYSAATPVISNNGLITGQYNAPIFEFLFPENLGIGSPPVPLNLQDFPFLVNGTFGALPGVNVGQLAPFPSAPAPASLCGPPPNPVPPTAVANANPLVTTAGAPVALDGSASSDPNGLAIAWSWIQTAGPTTPLVPNFFVEKPAITAPPIVPPATSLTLTYQLVVTNTMGIASLPSFVTITVNPPSGLQNPIANAGAAQTVGAGTIVQLNGTASTDLNVPAQTLTYAWTQTAGPAVTLSNAAAVTPTFRAPTPFPSATTLTFSLTVTNTSALSSAPSTVNITVNPVASPVANAGPNQTVNPGVLVTLNGSLSSDPNGLPLTYLWQQVSGLPVVLSNATAVKPTFTSPASSTVGLTLTVNNGFVSSLAALVSVNVNTAGNDAVIITIAEYRTGKQRLTVTATSSIPDGTPILTLVGYGPNGIGIPMPFLGGGLYTVILTGVPIPASVTVTSSLGGSNTSALTAIRL
jgi:hypothetical protein